jgi:hypothetical protein
MDSHNIPQVGKDRAGMQLVLIAALTFLLVLAFYFYTLQPTLAWGDGVKVQLETITGESFIQSILPDDLFNNDPHPFARVGVAAWDHPLFTMLGYSLVNLLPGLHAPWLVNILSALFGAGTILILFLLCNAHTRSIPVSVLAALAVAVSHTFWFHSVTAEVYTLFAFLLLLSLYLFDLFERKGHFALLVASLFTLGLGISNHLMAVLYIPAILIYLVITRGRSIKGVLYPGKILILALAFLVGLSPYLVQFMRMLRIFTLSEALGPVIGSVFLQGLLSTTPGDLLNSLLTYLMFLVYQFNPLGLIIGIFGFLRGRRISGSLWAKLIAFYLVFTVFGLLYRVTDQFAFFLISHVFYGIAIALGLKLLTTEVSLRWQYMLYAAFGLLILITPLFYNQVPRIARRIGVTDEAFGIPEIGTGIRFGLAYYLDPNQRADREAYQFGRDFFLNAPQDALVIAEWYTDTDEFFILQYFSTVEGLRPDIEIVGWPLEDPFHFDADLAVDIVEQQIQSRPVFLASLSNEFYDASGLLERYCIIPELNFYRVYPPRRAAGVTCLTG